MSALPRPAKIFLPLVQGANLTGNYGSVGNRVYTWVPNVDYREFPLIEARRVGGTRHPIKPKLLGTPIIEFSAYTTLGLPETEQLYEDFLEVLYDAVLNQTVTQDGSLSSIKEIMGATNGPSQFQDSWWVHGLVQLGIRPPRPIT